MEKVIVTALLIIGGSTAAVVVIFSVITSSSATSGSAAETQQETAARNRTNIEVIAVAVRPGGTKIDAWVKNVGTIPITAIEKSSLFLIRPGLRFEGLSYNNDGVTSKTWYADLKESGLPWNQRDTLHIIITLSAADRIDAVDDYVLRMSTANGKTAERVFGSY